MSKSEPGFNYARWKKWDRFFEFTPVDGEYFHGECRGLAIAGATIFEIGFGAGDFIAWADSRGAEMVAGSEVADAPLEAARARGIELLPAGFETVAADHEARFDTVVAFDVFEHFSLEEIAIRLRALETMLKRGGHLLLRFPNAQSPFGLALQHGDPTHRTPLSRDVFQFLIQAMKFEIIRYAPSHRIPGKNLRDRILRRARYMLRDALGKVFNAIYGLDIRYDPVVVIVLRRI